MKNIDRKINKLKTRVNSLKSEQSDILNRNGEIMVRDDELLFNDISSEIKDVQKQISTLETARDDGQDLSDDLSKFKRLAAGADSPIGTVPAQPKRLNLSCFSNAKTARRFGLWIASQVLNMQQAQQICEREGVSFNAAMSEGSNISGGYLVPTEFSDEIINLIEKRSVFRQNAQIVPMGSDTLEIPRQTGNLTVYFPGEGDTITASDLSFDQVELSLRKMATITALSNELVSDSIVPVFDWLARQIAWAIADKEDECGFNGDGSSTFGGVVGLRQQLIEQALGGTASGAVPAGSGLVRYDTGNAYTNIGIEDLTKVVGKLPGYAQRNARWFMSRVVWSYVLDLIADAGGNTMDNLANGTNKRILGYPVELVDVMPKSSAVNQVVALLGDLSLAATLGIDERGLRVEQSNSAYVGSSSMFETDRLAIRGISRFDINCHDVGSTTTTGPIVGLISHTA